MTPGPNLLDRGVVAVGYLPLGGIAQGRAEEDLGLLSPDERTRHARLPAPGRVEFRSARALLRRMLSHYSDRDPRAWRFSLGAKGKPEIAGAGRAHCLAFNVSHTRGLVACAVSRATPVGIDVEWSGRSRRYEALVRRVLAPAERAEVESLAASLRAPRFLDYWTLKEAHLKAAGTGLRVFPGALEFRLRGERGARCLADPEAKAAAWHYLRLRPTSTHLLAVAFAGRDEPRWEIVSPCP
ncbi:MAG: 4'-phosphopantetheinyl transferase superfamily protein [Myxococcota bacterium]|nr:4'-phosphopantetheinyl transferase superfamily protein [Myxococcota bacterium]